MDFPMHVENAVEIFYCTAGQSTVKHMAEDYTIQKGDIFFCFPNQPHGYFNSRDVEGYIVIIPVKPMLMPYYSILMYQQPVCPVLKNTNWENGDIGALLTMAEKDRDNQPDPIMQGYALTIVGKTLGLLELRQGSSTTENVIRNIIFYLNEHYKEAVTRKQVAEALGYNESYVSHLFSNSLRTSLPKYVNSLRLYDAVSLLADTEMPVAEIATSLGFGSIRSMNRVFLQETGMTPREYRQSKRNKTPAEP